MNILFKAVTIIDSKSKHHNKQCDVLVKGEQIVSISAEEHAIPKGTQVIDIKGFTYSPWFCR